MVVGTRLWVQLAVRSEVSLQSTKKTVSRVKTPYYTRNDATRYSCFDSGQLVVYPM
jgi:hypothetical protein